MIEHRWQRVSRPRCPPRGVLALALGLALLAPLAALAGELVVLRSTESAWRPGALVSGDATVELPAGGALRLLSASGEVVELRGPYAGRPAARASADPGTMERLADLLRRTLSTERVAAVYRGAEPGAGDVDVRRAGTYCVKAGEARLTRYPNGRALRGELWLEGTGSSGAAVRWSSRQISLPWPPEVPLRDGATYGFRSDGEVSRFTIVVLPASPDDLVDELLWMDAQGCRRQLQERIRQIAR